MQADNNGSTPLDVFVRIGTVLAAIIGSVSLLISRIRRKHPKVDDKENGNGGTGKMLNERVQEAYEQLGESYESLSKDRERELELRRAVEKDLNAARLENIALRIENERLRLQECRVVDCPARTREERTA